MRRRQKHQHLTASDPNHNPRGAPRSVPDIKSPGFGDSSGYPSGIPSDNPTKYPYPVPIIKSASGPSETPTKHPSYVPKEFPSAKPRNFLIEYPSRYLTGSTSTIPTDKLGSNTISHPISDLDALKQGIQVAQASSQINIMLFILHII